MATLTKVTSLASSPNSPTPPYPTPRTEAQDDVDNPPAMDLSAVGNILTPIQELLNESAYDEKYPSPPVNTPENFSPAPSVYSYGRGRGFSLIGDRLANFKHDDQIIPNLRDTTSSTRSVAPPASEQAEEGSDDEAIPSSTKPKVNLTIDTALSRQAGDLPSARSGNIEIGLGSPHPNPRIAEYIAFRSPNKHNREDSIKSQGGISENSNWAEDAEEKFDEAIKKLEQLAHDEHEADKSIPEMDYFFLRLQNLLKDEKRKFPVDVQKLA